MKRLGRAALVFLALGSVLDRAGHGVGLLLAAAGLVAWAAWLVAAVLAALAGGEAES